MKGSATFHLVCILSAPATVPARRVRASPCHTFCPDIVVSLSQPSCNRGDSFLPKQAVTLDLHLVLHCRSDGSPVFPGLGRPAKIPACTLMKGSATFHYLSSEMG